MSEGFNIEDINNNFSKLAEVLDSIKAQNAINIGDTSRILNAISLKLDELSSAPDENHEIVSLLQELQNSVSDRSSYINVKFAELEAAIKDAQVRNADLLTESKVKELFDVLSTNISVFSKQVLAQGDVLNEITLRIEALRTDDTDRREIIKSVNTIKNDLDKFNNGFESIILNVNSNFEGLTEKVLQLDPTKEVTIMKNSLSDVKNTSDIIMSAVQIVDQKQNKLTESIDEVVSQNTKINANIKALAGQSDFDGLVRKIESAIELITTLKGALTDTNEQSQKALLLQLDKLSAVVTKILTEEDFQIFKNDLSKLVNDVIESTNVMRGDIIGTTSEFKSLAKVISEVDFDGSYNGLRTLIDDKTRDIKESFVDIINNSNLEPIKNNLNLLVEKLDIAKDSITDTNLKLQEKANEKIDSVITLADKIREMVTYMPETIKQGYMPSEDRQNMFASQCLKNLVDIEGRIRDLKQDLKQNLSELTNPLRDVLIEEIKHLGDIVVEVKNFVSNNEEISSKIHEMETILGRVAGNYDIQIQTLQTNLIEYMSHIKDDCESADIKMNNFAFELNTIHSELGKVFADYKDAAKSHHDKFNSVCNGISSRFDAVLSAIEGISDQPEAIKGIKDSFDNVEHCMQDLLLAMSDIKVALSANKPVAESVANVKVEGEISSDSILKIENKLNKLKDQLNFMSTDFMENLYNCKEAVLNEFEPIKKSFMSLVDVDFQNVANFLKEQMNIYKDGMEKLLGELYNDNSQSVLNDLFGNLSAFENKFINLETAISDSMTEKLAEIKELIKEKKASIPQGNASSAADLGVKEINGLVELIDEKIVEVKNNFSERFENIHKHLDEAVIPKISGVDEKQNQIISKLDNLIPEHFEEIKNRLNELFERLSNVQDEMFNAKLTSVNSEKYADLKDDEKSLIADFTANLSELANLVKHSSDCIDEKVTRAFQETNLQANYESLKADISKMFNELQQKAQEITPNVENSVNLPAEFLSKLDEYKSQILSEISAIKQSSGAAVENTEIWKDLKVISQKIDLISLSDNVKEEIDQSLKEIKNAVKDQQKFLNTVNILETLSTLEDINKMKGIEQLNKLSEIISVEKLNALNKLSLLDKLKTLECLDEIQNIPKISGMIDIQNQLKVLVSDLDKKFSNYTTNTSAMGAFTENIKGEIDSAKAEIANTKMEVANAKNAVMKHILNVFEQMSFVVEGEEIKDFVDEKTNLILEQISNNAKLENLIDEKSTIMLDFHNDMKDLIEEKATHILDCILNNDNMRGLLEERAQAIIDLINDHEGQISARNFIENTLESKLNSFTESIQKFPTDVSYQLDEINRKISDQFGEINRTISEPIDDMVRKFNLMRVGSTEDDGNYSYTMQDVESDIARLRLALDDIKKVVESNSLKEIADYVNEIVRQVDSMKFNISQDDIFKMRVDVERIASDIVSISSRTNKLLLASDESANALNSSMISFRDTMGQLYEGMKKLDSGEISRKLEDIESKLSNNTKTQSETAESLAKLTVWANNTDETISDVSDALSKLKKALPSNEGLVEEIEVKFAKQQQKIDALEEKLDELLSLAENNGSSNMSKKLTDIEKQLTRLNKSIERLTSYVDEE